MSENRIKDLREAAGLKQEGLGRICGVGQSAISSWEQGVMPRRDALIRLCEYFNVSAGYILGIEDERGHTDVAGYDFVKQEPIKLSSDEKKLINRFRDLDDDNKEELLFRALELVRKRKDTVPEQSPALIG